MFKFQNDDDDNQNHAESALGADQFDRQTVVVIIIVVETLFLLATTIWTYIGQIDLRPLFRFRVSALIWGLSAGLAISASNLALLYLSQKFSSKVFILKSMHDLLKREMMPLFGRLTLMDSVLVSLASGICEEIFFRGILETTGGIATSATCFSLAHLPSFYYFPYAIWALLVGLIMSFIMAGSGSIIAPIVAHTLVNFISINVLRYIKSQ